MTGEDILAMLVREHGPALRDANAAVARDEGNEDDAAWERWHREVYRVDTLLSDEDALCALLAAPSEARAIGLGDAGACTARDVLCWTVAHLTCE